MRSRKKLETFYEGDAQVKVAKLQSLKGKYETLNMGDENITSFIDKVNELVMKIRCVGGTLEEDEISAKVLRSFPPAYKPKVVAIDGIQSVTTITRDMLVGKLVAFELSEFGESHGKTEIAFKASVSGKQKYDLGESSLRVSRYEREMREMEEQERELDELEALIARTLPKGVNKYDGKLPLKYFSCNKIGHFASRCPERMSMYDMLAFYTLMRIVDVVIDGNHLETNWQLIGNWFLHSRHHKLHTPACTSPAFRLHRQQCIPTLQPTWDKVLFI